MQISTLKYSELNEELRIDAEFYRKEILDTFSLLESKYSDKLGNLVSFIAGPFGSTVTADKYIQKSNYRYIRNKDINDFVIKDDDPVLIPEKLYDLLPQFHVKEKDLLITVVGTLGKVAIAKKKDTKSLFSCKSTILRTNKINPYYLLTYLNSNIGKLFSLRGARGAIQEGLNLFDLKEIKVFLPKINFQFLIEKLLKNAFLKSEKAYSCFQQAHSILLSEFGFKNWEPKHKLTYVKNYSDAKISGRIDAEYFQPKYNEIVKAIKNYQGGFDTLGNLASIKKCIEVGSKEYLGKGVPFIRVSNIYPFEIKNEKYISKELYSKLMSHQPKKGEILLSKDASPGIAYFLNENPVKMIPSGGILRIKIKNTKIIPEYLFLVLNSLIVKEQINRDVGGSVILHWRPDQAKNTLIPILKNNKQEIIKDNITKSTEFRQKSKALLEIAKKGVELSIEKDEIIAEKWIRSEIAKIDVNINI
jgi:restriction endonuclease S subunit